MAAFNQDRSTLLPESSIDALIATVLADPYHLPARRMLADAVYQAEAPHHPIGTPSRGKFLLGWMSNGFPTPTLRAAYLQNLRILLHQRPIRTRPGRLVLGLGSGRSGSTSLSHIVSGVADACATHENPPMIFWLPEPEQVAFHLERFALLLDYHDIVFDAAHWWLHVIDAVSARFPDTRFIGTRRKLDTCVDSFLRIKGIGPGTLHHWLPRGCAAVARTTWDPTYPSYNLMTPAEGQTLAGKRLLIETYVRDYNARMKEMAAHQPHKWLLLATEKLHWRGTQQLIFDHIGAQGDFTEARLNVGTIIDGQENYKI